jgi:tetratricopeptide (TPR) repeat protein
MATDSWIEDLRADRVTEAIDYLRHEIQSSKNYPSNYYSLGAAYMWAEDYRSALAHFDEQIRARLARNAPGDAAFGMAGTAAWCLGEDEKALEYWRQGTNASYAVGGANTRTALLLYAASLLKPGLFPTELAGKILSGKTTHWRIENWPGPIAQFVLGTLSEREAREKAFYRGNDLPGPNSNSWQLEFYKQLMLVASSVTGTILLRSEFQNLIRIRGSEYLAGLKLFYFLRLEEFYLARHWLLESSSIN